MKEEQLQYIWLNRLFDRVELGARDVEVLNVGHHNTHAGADFQMAHIRVEDYEWVGDVEIHERSSMWSQHGHHKDENYNTVVLHVVCVDDGKVYDAVGREVPTAVMHLDDEVMRRIQKLSLASGALRCMPELANVEDERVRDLLSILFEERISRKVGELVGRSSEGHLNSIFYQTLMRYMGAHQNNDTMELVASSLPYLYLKKHSGDLVALEAMLLGQAGLIEEIPCDEYEERLLSEYKFYKTKFALQRPEELRYSYLRLRPTSYPSRMLGIVAQIIHHEEEMMSALTSLDRQQVERLLSVAPSEYWQKHIAFGHLLERRMGGIGRQTLKSLIINVVIPTVCYYSMQVGDEQLKTKAMNWMRELAPEQNKYVRIFEQNGLKPNHALDSQALLELYHNYCTPYRCLSCPMASEIFRHLRSI